MWGTKGDRRPKTEGPSGEKILPGGAAMLTVLCVCRCRVAVCAAQYLPCLSRLGSRWVRAPPAAAAGASWRPACSPPALSPWQILCKGKALEVATMQHGNRWMKQLRWLTPTGRPAPGWAQRRSRWWWEGWSRSSSTWDPRRRWSEKRLKTQRSSVVVARHDGSGAERLRSRYRGQPSIPPWWCTGKPWARQRGCCRTAWCRRWGRSRCRCTHNWSGTSSPRMRTPALTSPPSRSLKKQDMNTVVIDYT